MHEKYQDRISCVLNYDRWFVFKEKNILIRGIYLHTSLTQTYANLARTIRMAGKTLKASPLDSQGV